MKEIIIDGTQLRVYDDGNIERFSYKKWKLINSKNKNKKYYLNMTINNKTYLIHRIIAYVFLELDLNSKMVIDHINHDIQNNSINNLRVVTHQQNCFNKYPKGYSEKIRINKNNTVIYYETHININGLGIYKTFKTKEEAHNHYLELKHIHHIL